MLNIRPMVAADVLQVKECNRRNLPENYHFLFLGYSVLVSAGCSFVAENEKGETVGYALAKLEDERDAEASSDLGLEKIKGHITSLAVDTAYRKRGIGSALLAAALYRLGSAFLLKTSLERIPEQPNPGMGSRRALDVLLNVRVANETAIALYRDSFGFVVEKEELGYYADGEASLVMRKCIFF